jgi:hypothetical protein
LIYIFLTADKLFKTRSEPCFWVMLVGAVHCSKLLASAFLATQFLNLRVEECGLYFTLHY